MYQQILSQLPRYVPLLIFILFSIPVVAIVFPSAPNAFHPQNEKRENPGSLYTRATCGFKGDNDTYGLGIRISIYIN